MTTRTRDAKFLLADGVVSPSGGPLRVLICGINYAPEHSGIAPYTTQAAEHLARQGADVLVLTGVPHYPSWSVPSEYRHRLSSEHIINAVAVRRLRHYVPTRQSALKRAVYEATYGLQVCGQRLPWKPDVVIGVVPSLLGAAAGSAIARRNGARFVVWVQDVMGLAAARSGIPGGACVAGMTGSVERAVLRRADQVIVLNDVFARYVAGAGVPEEQIRVVRNWTHAGSPRGERSDMRRRLGWTDDDVVALHCGNMGLKQGLENVIEAARLSQAERCPIRFVLMGDGSQRIPLQRLAADVQNLDFLAPVALDDFPDVLCAADVLLVNERREAVDMSLPSKLTSYFQTGLPVVAAVAAHGGTAKEVEGSGAGFVVSAGDARALLLGIERLSTDKELQALFRSAAASHVERHLSATASLKELTDAVFGPLPRRGSCVGVSD